LHGISLRDRYDHRAHARLAGRQERARARAPHKSRQLLSQWTGSRVWIELGDLSSMHSPLRSLLLSSLSSSPPCWVFVELCHEGGSVGQQIGAASVVRTTSCRRRRCHREKCASSPPLHAFGAKLKPYLLSLITTADDFASILSACITSMRCHCACLARCELVNAMIILFCWSLMEIYFAFFMRAYYSKLYCCVGLLTMCPNLC
jgi:hypothetical protein